RRSSPPTTASSAPSTCASAIVCRAARCSSSWRTPKATDRRSEQLLELHGRTHVALDLQLPRHVGRRRVLLAGDDLVERLPARGDRRVRVAAALAHVELSVRHGDEPLSLAVDVEEVRVVHAGELRLVRARLQAVEELLGCHRCTAPLRPRLETGEPYLSPGGGR